MELQGLADGSKEAGCSECGDYANRAIVLANAPGDLQVSVILIPTIAQGSSILHYLMLNCFGIS